MLKNYLYLVNIYYKIIDNNCVMNNIDHYFIL